MRLIIATGIYPPDIGGPASYVSKIAPVLQEKGFDVSILSYGDKDELLDLGGINLIKVARNRGVFSRYWNYFIRLFRQTMGADVIYAQDPMSSGLPSFLVGALLGKRLIIKIVGDYVWEQATQRFGSVYDIEKWQKAFLGPKLGLWRALERWISRRADRIIVPSQYLKKIVKYWGVPSQKIIVIYNAIDLPNTVMFSQDKDENLWLSVCRLVPWKGVEMIIRLMRNFPEKKLEIIGDGPERQKLENLIKSLGLEGRVEVAGRLDHGDTITRLGRAQLLLLNTSYEGLSHTILEALFVGTLVITTPAGGNEELIKDGENGFLLPYNDIDKWTLKLKWIIVRQLADGKWRTENSSSTKEFFRKFNFDYMIDELVKVLS